MNIRVGPQSEAFEHLGADRTMDLNDPHAACVAVNRSRLIDAVIDAYATWREESAEVTAAYLVWGGAPRNQRATAYAAYVTALDSEEGAASVYQRLVEQAAA